MKRTITLLLQFLICCSIFAQMTYTYLGDSPGSCVVYQEKNGNMINLVNAKDYYIIRYRDLSKNTAYSCKVKIKKDFYTEITYVESIEGTKENYDKLLLPIIKNLFFYTDMNMRKNLPSSFTTTKKDLVSGKITRSGLVDFYIPITNLIYEKDETGTIITKCIQFGIVNPNEVKYFLDSSIIPEPIVRKMNKVKLQNIQNVKYNNFTLKLPANWILNDGYYVLPDTTKRDALIYTEKVSLKEMQLDDFYAYIMAELLKTNALVIPDSFKMEKIGNAICFTYNVMDYKYHELNTCKVSLFSQDGINFNVLKINGYFSFIDQNIEMINRIIETAEVK